MNDRILPGGQPYTPPRELTEEELEEIWQFLNELKKKSEEGEGDDK
jgi:hypothetical protein